MVKLADLVGATREVELMGHKFLVPGISTRGMAILATRFQVFADLMLGKGFELTLEQILAIPDMCAAIIACGMGHEGDTKLEARIVKWNLRWQAIALNAIWDETEPAMVPLVALIERLKGISAGRGKAPATKSPSRSRSSSPSATRRK